MSENRVNAYHIMWLFVFFDLPVVTKKQRKSATLFRKLLERDGFGMMQYSVYIRHCGSYESMEAHTKGVQSILPEEGHVCILNVTDKQYGNIVNFYSVKPHKKSAAGGELKISQPMQLELF